QLNAALTTFDGTIQSASGQRFVAVFRSSAGNNPVMSAARAAEQLMLRGHASACSIDLANLSIQKRASGPDRLMSPLFQKTSLFLPPGLGLAATERALAAVPELKGPGSALAPQLYPCLSPGDKAFATATANDSLLDRGPLE